MMLTQVERRVQSQAAEDRFRAWLDRCRLADIYVDQAPATFPDALHGKIKRPDFLVGFPTVGTVAVEADEYHMLANFEAYFSISMWFACFPPDELHVCHLILNRNLAALPVSGRRGKPQIAELLKIARLARERRDFMAPLLGAISVR